MCLCRNQNLLWTAGILNEDSTSAVLQESSGKLQNVKVPSGCGSCQEMGVAAMCCRWVRYGVFVYWIKSKVIGLFFNICFFDCFVVV